MTITEVQTIEQLRTTLGSNIAKIKISFKAGKVTAGCRCNAHSYGAKGQTLAEALTNLQARLQV